MRLAQAAIPGHLLGSGIACCTSPSVIQAAREAPGTCRGRRRRERPEALHVARGPAQRQVGERGQGSVTWGRRGNPAWLFPTRAAALGPTLGDGQIRAQDIKGIWELVQVTPLVGPARGNPGVSPAGGDHVENFLLAGTLDHVESECIWPWGVTTHSGLGFISGKRVAGMGW